MLLHWSRTTTELFAQPPMEAFIEPSPGPAVLPLAIEELDRLARDFSDLACRCQVHHVLIAEFAPREKWTDWVCDAPIRTVSPVTGWHVWSVRFAPNPTADGAVGLQGRIEAHGGEPGDLDRFHQLVFRAASLVGRVAGDERALDESHLFATWMLDLYRSAQRRLGALRAVRRVRVGKLEMDYEHLLELVAGTPRGRVENEVRARVVEAGGVVPCWAAHLQPDCCSASITKLRAVRMRLEAFRHANARPDRAAVTAGDAPAPRREAADAVATATTRGAGDADTALTPRLPPSAGVASPDRAPVQGAQAAGVGRPVLKPDALLVLRTLHGSRTLLTTTELGVRIRRSRHTVGRHIKELIGLGFADRPKGPKGGVVITEGGWAFLDDGPGGFDGEDPE